jgi:hypothetical protein
MLRSGWRTCCALFPVGSAFEGDHLDHCCVCSPHVSASLRTDGLQRRLARDIDDLSLNAIQAWLGSSA